MSDVDQPGLVMGRIALSSSDGINHTLRAWNMRLKKQLAEAQAQYSELVMQVGTKHEGESRHDTALRYLRQAERPSGCGCTKETT